MDRYTPQNTPLPYPVEAVEAVEARFGIITCHPERLPVTGVGRPRIVKL